jgi:rubredoxin
VGLASHLRLPGWRCPECGFVGDRRLEFRYGYQRSETYTIGDRIDFSLTDQDIGQPTSGCVEVLAKEMWCPSCKFTFGEQFVLVVEGRRITEVRELREPWPDGLDYRPCSDA